LGRQKVIRQLEHSIPGPDSPDEPRLQKTKPEAIQTGATDPGLEAEAGLVEDTGRVKLRKKWMTSDDTMAARTGWNLTASRVNKGADGLDLPALLDRIEKEMPKAMPEVQWTTNNTLGAIGIHDPKLRKRAVAIGEKIGLYRDWPVAKGCIPP
jgi:hypothetical protein